MKNCRYVNAFKEAAGNSKKGSETQFPAVRILQTSDFRLLTPDYCFASTGSPAFFQASKPPRSAAALSIPFALSVTTELADVCSLGQEQ